MGTKRSLIEVVHDDGYGDALLMHINHAFGSKDMRVERVVQSEPRFLPHQQRVIDEKKELSFCFFVGRALTGW